MTELLREFFLCMKDNNRRTLRGKAIVREFNYASIIYISIPHVLECKKVYITQLKFNTHKLSSAQLGTTKSQGTLRLSMKIKMFRVLQLHAEIKNIHSAPKGKTIVNRRVGENA